MTSISARRGLATLLCSGVAAVAVLLPSAAHADTLTVPDPVGDVVGQGRDGSSVTPAPKARTVDLVSTRLDHRSQVLVVRGTAVKAAKDVGQFVRVKGGGRNVSYVTGPGGSVLADDGSTCAGASRTVNTQKATYTVKIPTRCFGSPARVRVGLALSRINSTSEGLNLDDAMRDGLPANARDLKLSKAVARG